MVIDDNDLVEQRLRSVSQYAVDGPQEHGQGFVVERDDDCHREIITGVVQYTTTRLGPRVDHISFERCPLALRHVYVVCMVRRPVRVQENRALQFAESVRSHLVEQLRLPAGDGVSERDFVARPVEKRHQEESGEYEDDEDLRRPAHDEARRHGSR